jgi:hypothetical protein
MSPKVELTKLGVQNFKLDLYSENFCFENERSFGTASLKHYRTVKTHSKVTINSSFGRELNSKIIFSVLFDQNRSFFKDFRPTNMVYALLKIRILTRFLGFFANIFKNKTFRLNLTKAFD